MGKLSVISKGTIAIDVQFVERAAGVGVSAIKTIALQDIGEHLTGKVAIVSGTCGTAVTQIGVSPSTYKNVDGDAVSFATIERVAFSADRRIALKNQASMSLISGSTLASISDAQGDTGPLELHPEYTSGTASYVIVIYGT